MRIGERFLLRDQSILIAWGLKEFACVPIKFTWSSHNAMTLLLPSLPPSLLGSKLAVNFLKTMWSRTLPPPLLSPAPRAINNDTSLNSRWCSCVIRPWSIPCGNPHFILQTGMISLSNDTFFIHPLPNHLAKHVTIRNAAKPHLVYRKSATSLHCLDSSGMRRPFSPNLLESVVRFLWCLLVEKFSLRI